MPRNRKTTLNETVSSAANAESIAVDNVNPTAEEAAQSDSLNTAENAVPAAENAAPPVTKRGGKRKKPEESDTSVKETTISEIQPSEDAAVSAAPVNAEPKRKGGKKPKAEKAVADEKNTSKRQKASTVTDVPEKSTQRKKPGRKPAALSAEKICDLLKKKLDKNAVASVSDKIAVDIEIWGVENEPDRRLYIEIKDGKAEIQPYSYDDKDIKVYISYSDAFEILNGKLTLKDAVFSGKLTVQIVKNEGNILPAMTLASIIKC